MVRVIILCWAVLFSKYIAAQMDRDMPENLGGNFRTNVEIGNRNVYVPGFLVNGTLRIYNVARYAGNIAVALRSDVNTIRVDFSYEDAVNLQTNLIRSDNIEVSPLVDEVMDMWNGHLQRRGIGVRFERPANPAEANFLISYPDDIIRTALIHRNVSVTRNLYRLNDIRRFLQNERGRTQVRYFLARQARAVTIRVSAPYDELRALFPDAGIYILPRFSISPVATAIWMNAFYPNTAFHNNQDIVNDVARNLIYQTIAHEFGHALGLMHPDTAVIVRPGAQEDAEDVIPVLPHRRITNDSRYPLMSAVGEHFIVYNQRLLGRTLNRNDIRPTENELDGIFAAVNDALPDCRINKRDTNIARCDWKSSYFPFEVMDLDTILFDTFSSGSIDFTSQQIHYRHKK